MKKYLISLSLIIVFAFYALFASRQSTDSLTNLATDTTTFKQPLSTAPSSTSNISASGNVTSKSTAHEDDEDYQPPVVTASPTKSSVTSTSAGAKLTLKDGTYTGPATDAYFGIVQVKATVASGKITNVAILQYPSDRSTSKRINNTALPKLISESITAQSATVDAVSGATQTSRGYMQSLAGALALASK